MDSAVPSQTIGRYRIVREIGRGGMAIVYEARDPNVDRAVAVKVLPPAFNHDLTFRMRFEREAKTVAALEHRAIVPIYDYGEESLQPYIVMRYMEGGSLADRLRRGPLAFAEIKRILDRVSAGIDFAHMRGVIHRDLKPENLYRRAAPVRTRTAAPRTIGKAGERPVSLAAGCGCCADCRSWKPGRRCSFSLDAGLPSGQSL